MKSFETAYRTAISVVLALFVFAALAPQNLLGQTVSSSPASLAFGIPTGTQPPSAPQSAPQTVTVNITGSGSVTFSSFALSVGSPFTIAGNSCANPATTPPNTFTAPATCQITITLTTTSTTLVTDTLIISYGSESSLSVPLSGAYGAIELWEETNVTQSVATASYTSMYSIASVGLNLSCPSSPTATLSYTPDGRGYVLVDNYLTLAIGGTAVSNGNNPPGNVCSGGTSDSSGGISYNDCFSTNYQVPAGTNYGLNGDDPDTFTNPGNQFLSQQPGNQNNAGGVPAINVNSYFPAGGGTVQATFTALDSGYVYTSSTLFLVTNCSPAGIIPGGSVTLNPINTSNPQSETQTATFSSSPGQNISVTTSDAVAIQGGTQIPSGIVPIFTDYAVPQQLFNQLVAGTSAAPAVCLRMSAEVDEFDAPMCKGFLLQCYDPSTQTTTGDNCAPTLSTARNLYYAAQFSSPDGPVNGLNFLYGPVGTPAADACSNVLSSGGSCAVGTGPGMLMGGDNWLCAVGGSPCPAVATTQTPLLPPTYTTANCVLTGSVAGALCPLDILTEFEGAADIKGGSTTDGGNSIIIPVANMPLPAATATVASENSNKWIHGSSTISATFNSSAATYSGTGNVPPPNMFLAASPYSLTYGISTWPTLPDTTYPVTGDLTNSNSFTTTTSPFCNSGGTTPQTFGSAGSFSGLSDGIYNLHYFTTDCAFTEGLIFNPTGSALTDPTANWASFPFVTVGIDNLAPQVSSCTSAPTSTGGWYGANFSQYCTVADQSYTAGVSGSGFLPLLANSIQGSPSEVVTVTTNAAAGAVSLGVPATAASSACDLAGNCIPVSTGSYNFDLQPPTITGPTLGSAAPYYVNGPPITVTFSCSDGAGSGIGSCTASGPGYSLSSCTGSAPVSCTGTISTSSAVSGTLAVTAIDNVGNKTTSSVNYVVSLAPSADVWVGDIPLPLFIAQGKTGNYYPWAIDLSSSTANNVVVTSTFTVPNKVLNGGITGTYSTVSCSKTGCSGTPTGGTSCSVSTTVGASTTVAVLTCNIGQLVSISKLQGVVMKINIPILSTAAVNTTFSSVTAVTSDNDPNSKNNSVSETYTVIK